MRDFAIAHAQSGISDRLPLFLISVLLTAVGAFLAFDLFGFVSKRQFPRSATDGELQQKWALPDSSDVRKLVAWIFLIVGVPLLILSVAVEIALLLR